jgi:hypothetical protein
VGSEDSAPCLDKVKTCSSKRLPSRCEKAGQADDVLRTFALKPYGKHGERDDHER